MRIFLNMLLLFSIPFSETLLNGDISAQHFTKDRSPFIVSETIFIPKGKSVTIDAGCLFLFGNFTGLTVDGELIVNGTPDNPVVFTSISDNQYSEEVQSQAMPGDWNGITISDKAIMVRMSHFLLAYSVYGVKSNIDEVYVSNGDFLANDQYGFTRKDAVEVPSGNIRNYTSANNPQNQTSTSGDTIQAGAIQNATADSLTFKGKQPKQKNSQQDNNVRLFLKSRYGIPVLLTAAGVISGVVAGVFANNFSATNKTYSEERDAAVRADLEKKAKQEIAGITASGIVCIGTIPSAVIIFLKRKDTSVKTTNISVLPFFSYSTTGVVINARF